MVRETHQSPLRRIHRIRRFTVADLDCHLWWMGQPGEALQDEPLELRFNLDAKLILVPAENANPAQVLQGVAKALFTPDMEWALVR
jgi:hypothetical protein